MAEVIWKIRDGQYRVVVMSANGHGGFAATTPIGVTMPNITYYALAALLLGLAIAGGGTALLIGANRQPRNGSSTSCIRGSDADLLDVGAPIDNLAEEVADRPIGCVDRNPRAAGPNERLKLGDGQRLVSGNLGHVDRGKRTARITFDLAQGFDFARSRPSDLIHRPPTEAGSMDVPRRATYASWLRCRYRGRLPLAGSRDLMADTAFTMIPIGWVVCPRSDVIDDDWGDVVSRVTLDTERFTPDSLRGLEDFSHVEVVYVFDRMPREAYERGARRPRGNPDWPEVGVFAQRNKRRPNRIGVSVCRLLSVVGTGLTVQGLDAIDGTPVLDIKPYMSEFAPRDPVEQPTWSHELMSGYW